MNVFIETDDVGNLYWSNKHKQLHRVNGPAIEYSSGKKSFYVKGKLLTENQFKQLQNKIMNKSNKITKKELVSIIKEVVGEYRTKGALGAKNPNKFGSKKSSGKKATKIEVYYEENNKKEPLVGPRSITGLNFDFINNTWPRTKAFLEINVMATLGRAALSAKLGKSVFDELEKAKEAELDDLLTTDNNVVIFYLENNELKARTEGSVNEELIGNQKVLDKTGDGKLTAKDFEILRKSKK